MSIRSMQHELEQWAAWARGSERDCGIKPYTCPTYTMMLQNVGIKRKGSNVAITLDDDALIAIDHLVMQLKVSRPELYSVVHLHYLCKRSIADLARVAGCARYTIDMQLVAAETWLDCRLETICDMAAKVSG